MKRIGQTILRALFLVSFLLAQPLESKVVIDLESIHSPVDAILHSQKEEQAGLLENLFAKPDKGFNEEQRKVLVNLRPELAANPLVMSLYYRVASLIIRYHGRLYQSEPRLSPSTFSKTAL